MRAMGKAYSLFYEQALTAVRAEGVWLYDEHDRPLLDVYNNVPHVGHCHPRVVEAIARQSALLNTHTRYLNEGVIAYAERLTGLFPAGLDVAMFACSGTEANELALRIARVSTGGAGVIVTTNAYHGNSWAIAQVSPEEKMGEAVGEHVALVPPPSPQAGDFDGHVAAAVETLMDRGIRPAALMVDTIFSSEGIVTPPARGLSQAASIVRGAGGLFIADEVQAGFGRLGRHFWGFEAHGVRPDIVTMGKPMGNGYPVSAMVTSSALVDAFSSKAGYFNTFGGNPVACAAANAVLDVIEDEGLQANARDTGDHLKRGLEDLSDRFPSTGTVRGAGLYIGMDVETGQLAGAIANGMRERGVLIGRTGPGGTVLKFRPPLAFSIENTELLVDRLEETLRHVNA